MGKTKIQKIRSSIPATATADDYFDLIRKFPLRKINTIQQNNAALGVLGELVGRKDLSSGERDYTSALVTLVADFERRTLLPLKRLTPRELIQHLMESNDMSVSELGEIVGSQPAASNIVNGVRGVSKAQAKRLGEHFAVDAGAFI